MNSVRLKRVFDRPELARLVDRLQARFERGTDNDTITLSAPNLDERKAIANLLGRPVSRGRSIRLAIADLEQIILQGELAPSLRAVVELLRGPLRDLSGEKATLERKWQKVFENVAEEAAQLGADEWLDRLRKDGVLKRLSNSKPKLAATLLHQTLAVLRQLPGRGQTLSTLAANTLGDAHGLDTGRPVATLVKRAIEQSTFLSREGDQHESDRELWAGVGILIGGAITSTVLVLNLPVGEGSGSFSAKTINLAKHHGEPLWLTLRQLVRETPPWRVEKRTIRICENPAIIAEAADRLGIHSPPLVCTCGQPGAAVNHLLRQLHNTGAKLAYHGDYDWPGITIANGIMRRFDAHPWLFDEYAYRKVVSKGTMALKGSPVTAEWDPALSQAMIEKRTSIPEELILEELLKTLES
jgi:uncharacterized protein (TIGR02679 family)